jgi:hypothetical protein
MARIAANKKGKAAAAQKPLNKCKHQTTGKAKVDSDDEERLPTCWGCRQKGHKKPECPNPELWKISALIAAGEDDLNDGVEHDYDAYDDVESLFMATSLSCCASCEAESVRFTSTEILFDHQAGRSVFKTASLLIDVEPIESFTLGGINAKYPGLLIEHSGVFEDIKDVSWSRDAAANVISQSCAIDAGWTVSYYSGVADEYKLSKDNKLYTFARKRLASGEKCRHYVFDTSSSEQVLAATIAENMRRYQRREV